MQPTDQELARRLLSAVLDRLEGQRPTAPQASAQEVSSSRNGDPGIVLIVVGQSGDQYGIAENKPIPSETIEMKSPNRNNGAESHPGLEKFPLSEIVSKGAASKTCFMEPDRVCVNSGACEMRGY